MAEQGRYTIQALQKMHNMKEGVIKCLYINKLGESQKNLCQKINDEIETSQ